MSDRTWPDVTSTARVDVRELPQEALRNAASLRLASESHISWTGQGVAMVTEQRQTPFLTSSLLPDLTMDQFFGGGRGEESLFSRLGRTLAELLQTLPENVQIFSAGDAGLRREKALNVWFAAHGSPYYKEERLRGYVAANRAKVRTAGSKTGFSRQSCDCSGTPVQIRPLKLFFSLTEGN